MSKTIYKFIGVSVIAICMAFMVFAFSGCSPEKKVVGNWHLTSFTVSAEAEDLLGNEIALFKTKNVEQSKSSVFTFKEDNTFEHSLFGKLVSGKYAINGDELTVTPTSDNKGNLKETIFKIKGDKIFSNIGGEFEKCNVTAQDNNKQVRHNLGLTVIDLTIYLGHLEGISTDQVLSKFEALQNELNGLSDAEKNEVLKEVESQYQDKYVEAYNKLNDSQKEKVSALNQLLKFNVGK